VRRVLILTGAAIAVLLWLLLLGPWANRDVAERKTGPGRNPDPSGASVETGGRSEAGAPRSDADASASRPRRVALHGVVSTKDGPVWGLDVVVYPWGKESWITDATTDVNGRYRVELIPGRYDIEIRAEPSVKVARITRRMVEVEDDTEFDIRLDEGAVIEGTAVDKQGKPVAGIWIFAVVEPVRERGTPHDTNRALSDAYRGLAQTAPDGRFKIVGLGEREYFLQAANIHWRLAKPQGAVRGSGVRVEMERGWHIRAGLHNGDTRDPVEQFRMRAGGAWVEVGIEEERPAWVPAPTGGRRVEIEAEGYDPAQIDLYRQVDGVFTLFGFLVPTGPANLGLRVEHEDGGMYDGPVRLAAWSYEVRGGQAVYTLWRTGPVLRRRGAELVGRMAKGSWIFHIQLVRLAGAAAVQMPCKLEQGGSWSGRIILPSIGKLLLRRPAEGALHVDLWGPRWFAGPARDGVVRLSRRPTAGTVRWKGPPGAVVELDVLAGKWRLHSPNAREVEVAVGGSAELTLPSSAPRSKR